MYLSTVSDSSNRGYTFTLIGDLIDSRSIKIFCNKAAQLRLGFAADELRRMSVFDIYAEESRARVRVLFDRFRQGIAVENE